MPISRKERIRYCLWNRTWTYSMWYRFM